MSGLLETAGELAQARLSLTFQALVLTTILLERPTDLLEEVWGQGEDFGFALAAEGEGGRAMGFTAGAAAGRLTATAPKRNQRAAQEEGFRGG